MLVTLCKRLLWRTNRNSRITRERDDHVSRYRRFSKINPEEMLKAIAALCEQVRNDMAAHCQKMDAKYDAVMDAVKLRKRDEAGSRSGENEDDHGAGRRSANRSG